MAKKIEKVKTATVTEAPPMQINGGDVAFSQLVRMPDRFATINRLITRDLNDASSSTAKALQKYSKDQIATYLQNPANYEKQLRDSAIYLYGASSHFKRLVQYFAALSDLSYVVSPYRIDTRTANKKTIRLNFKRVLNLLSSMDIKNTFEKVLTVCIREDIFYGTIRETTDSTIVQQLPSDYCKIAVIENNVPNVSFDFSYFDTNSANLPLYPDEFRQKYDLYKKDRVKMKWQELASPNSFAIKANKEILSYAIPPFSGFFREIFDIESYKDLKLTKTELENYAILVMTLGVNEDGEWQMDLNKAKDFWSNLDGVLPDEIGSVLSPMPINKISFEKTHAGDTNTIADAEQNLYTAAGVSSLIFNNEKASSSALALSIKADQAMTYSIVKSIESMLNRFVHAHGYGKYFKVTFLDCSPYNRKELGDAYLKACQYGMPMVSFYCASQGLMQDEMDCMNYLEDDVLGIKKRFTPMKSSATQSSNDTSESPEGGRPESEIGELTDEGEKTRERGET